jgi:hypothetical protein
MLFLSYLQLALLWLTAHGLSYTYDVLKPKFHQEFVDSCSKYPFYHNYLNNLKHPPGRFVVFVFEEKNLKTGGMGDRMAGLLTAAGMAIRFNRTLIVRSQDGLGKLFRPYIPAEDEASLVGLVKYGNGSHDLDWARYNKSYANNDQTELDLYFCINHLPFANKYEGRCAHVGDEPSQPVILFRGNRCYLCHWHSNKRYKARQQLAKAIGGIGRNDDLYRVAGCLLRLALWPTDYFWSKIDEAFNRHYAELKEKQVIPYANDNFQTKDYLSSILPQYMLTLHFRCGDAFWEKSKPLDYCQHLPVNITDTVNSTQHKPNTSRHEESHTMHFGTPDRIATCAREKLLGLTKNMNASTENNLPVDAKVVVNLLSDNNGSATQMSSVLQWKNLVQAPHTCHIDRDHSFECLVDTAVYWFIMAMSDFFVVPSNDDVPVSGFSRYAAIYGLKEGSLINGRTCKVIDRKPLSRRHHENWYCRITRWA